MTIIYHSKDLDGYASGAICKKKFPNAKLVGYDYGQPIPWEKVDEGEPVIMIDVSLPMPDMYEMARRSNWQMTWIDHHISAINDYSKFINPSQQGKYNPGFLTSVLEVGIAACEIGWKHLFPEDEMPLAISLLGQYDTWRNQDLVKWENEILPFQYGMRQICNSAETFPFDLLDSEENNPFTTAEVDSITEKGRTILSYQKQINETACRKSFPATFKGLRAICLNGGGFNSQVFESVWDETKYDVMMPFQFDGKKYNFSIYTTHENLDCSVYAKQLGGGGHAKACGFSVEKIEDVLEIV